MSRAAGLAALALAVLLAPPSAQARSKRERPAGTGTANPSALVAMEIAFARMAQEKGQWTAFREFAAEDAVMFVPQITPARDWLKGRANPPQSVKWQPYQVWMSCDGTLGVTKGAWQRQDGSVGYFTTIWKRQGEAGGRNKADEYRWVLDQGDMLAEPLKEPEFLEATVADCQPGRTAIVALQQAETAARAGSSQDNSLHWQARVAADGSRRLAVQIARGGALREVLVSEVAAPLATQAD